MAKLTVIDVLNKYLQKGLKPPPLLLQAVAKEEALKQPAASVDPTNPWNWAALGAGGLAEQQLLNMATESVPQEWPKGKGPLDAIKRLVSGSAGLSTPQGSKVPQIVSKGAKKGLSGPATSDLAGGETSPLPKGMQHGSIVSKGTKLVPGGGRRD